MREIKSSTLLDRLYIIIQAEYLTQWHWVRKILWSRKWLPPPVSLPGKYHGHISLVGYSPWGPKESDRTYLTEYVNDSYIERPLSD